jgi:hypothetical protein
MMTGEEVKTLITQRSYDCENPDRVNGGHYWGFHPDSETALSKFTDNRGETTRAKGKLRYESDAVCVSWDRKDWNSSCYEFWRDGDVLRTWDKRNRKDLCVGKVVDGNPYDL